MNTIHHDSVHGEVVATCGHHRLRGIVHASEDAKGLVVFALGSGSARFSPRNQVVARALQDAGLATLLIDLLEQNEADDREKVFDIPLLAQRLDAAAFWAKQQTELASLNLGYFGASTGAGAALVAASRCPSLIGAIVSRGGRPDLAGDDLPAVKTPTLLIVGGDDDEVLELNQQAATRLNCKHRLTIVPGATHLFEEPGAIEQVARLAADWFGEHLGETVA